MISVINENKKARLRIIDERYKDDKGNDKGNRDIFFQYNPEKYTIGKTVVWTNQNAKGTTPTSQFTGQGNKTLAFELFFDTYEEWEQTQKDVRRYTSKILALTEPLKQDDSQPPICLFSWGTFNFRGIVKSVTQNFTLFTPEGIPVRARLNVQMEQFDTAQDKAKGQPPGDPEKLRIVKEGDRLDLIATDEYGTPHEWKRIAAANQIENPRYLSAGQTLMIPVLE